MRARHYSSKIYLIFCILLIFETLLYMLDCRWSEWGGDTRMLIAKINFDKIGIFIVWNMVRGRS